MQPERVLQPLEPLLQLPQIQLQEVLHSSAHVTWPQATYTLPDHDQDEEQVAFQLMVHYRVSYTLQLQQVSLGPPTADQPVEQLMASVPSAVVDSAWKDVLTIEDAPTQAMKVRIAEVDCSSQENAPYTSSASSEPKREVCLHAAQPPRISLL